MKTLALTIQFEDSVDVKAARQFVEGAVSHVPGYRAVTVQEPPEVMPLLGDGTVATSRENSKLLVRMKFLCPKQAELNHGQSLSMLASRGGVTPSEALALVERRPYRSMAAPDALLALLACTQRVPK